MVATSRASHNEQSGWSWGFTGRSVRGGQSRRATVSGSHHERPTGLVVGNRPLPPPPTHPRPMPSPPHLCTPDDRPPSSSPPSFRKNDSRAGAALVSPAASRRRSLLRSSQHQQPP